jgi:hypothetical protein
MTGGSLLGRHQYFGGISYCSLEGKELHLKSFKYFIPIE